MLLAIDVGNTNAVLGCIRDGKIQRTWRISTHPLGTADELRARLNALLQLDGLAPDRFDAVVASSVVPQFTSLLRATFAGTGKPLHFIDHSSPFSFRIKADPPHQVGADRLVNAEAALREYGAPAIIVDSGTATTVCALSRDASYLGGAIMPGIDLAIDSLAARTAQLFAVELVPPPRAIASNTQDALRSGVLLGYASMVDGMVRRFKQEMGEQSLPVVATGGVSQRLKGLATELTHFDADLTLKGIGYVHDALRSR